MGRRQPLVELVLAGYMTYGIVYLWQRGLYSALPFLVLFQVGFGYVAVISIYEGLRGRVLRWVKTPAVAPALTWKVAAWLWDVGRAVTVQPGATASARTVTVTTGGESASLSNAFTVLPGSPAITTITPNLGIPNTPSLAVDPPDGVCLNITGAGPLFGGEAALAEDLTVRLKA